MEVDIFLRSLNRPTSMICGITNCLEINPGPVCTLCKYDQCFQQIEILLMMVVGDVALHVTDRFTSKEVKQAFINYSIYFK